MADRIKLAISAVDKTGRAFRSVQGNLSKTERAAKTMSAAFAAMGGVAAIAGIVMVGKQSLDAADKIAKLSTRLGASTEALSQYSYAADRSGVSFDTFTMGLQRMVRRVAEAAKGTGEAKGALIELGVSAKELSRQAPDRQFEILADAISKVGNQSDKVRLAMKLFDSEGVSLLQMMDDGAEGIRRYREEADKFGKTLTKEGAKKAEEYADAVTKLDSAWDGFAQTVTLKVAPAITTLMNEMTGFGSTLSQDLADLAIADPAFHAQLRALSVPVNAATEAWYRAAIAAHEAGEEFSMVLKPLYQGSGLGVPNEAYKKVAPFDSSILANDMAEQDEKEAIDAIVESALAYDQALADMSYYANEARAGLDGLSESAATFGPYLDEGTEASNNFNREMAHAGVMAATQFGDAIVDAAMRGESALESLGNIAQSVFSSILSFAINLGISSLLTPAAAPLAGAIGPGIGGIPLGKSMSAGDKSMAGPISINSLNVSATSTLSSDPMTTRNLANQLYDEIRRVGNQRGNGGRI